MPGTDPGKPYGLHRPTVHDVHDAIHRVHGTDDGAAVWAHLLQTTGVSIQQADEGALHKLLDAMTSLDPVSRLCAHALRIRLSSHTHLAAAHTMIRS
ncbi:hypothetical protein [Actinoplanes philippinensis]|uniref:hypothetical protein n=1 Tax=Actinoplanes philippinensis TaxID=35752 RepID=UPI0033D84752